MKRTVNAAALCGVGTTVVRFLHRIQVSLLQFWEKAEMAAFNLNFRFFIFLETTALAVMNSTAKLLLRGSEFGFDD